MPEAPVTPASRAAENSNTKSQTKEKPDFHEAWFHWHERAKRLRAH
jgi:hypothetical protein